MIVLLGKTCSGKDTIQNKLIENGYRKIVTYTTRPPRPKEKDGETYNFIPEIEFKGKVAAGFFAEYKSYDTKFGKWYYGCAKEDISNSTDKDVIILTPEGLKDVSHLIQSDKIVSFYIYANNKTITDRLLKRGDNKSEAARRVSRDNEDFKGIDAYVDKIVYNNDSDNLDDVISKIITYSEELHVR